jgi:hypothetical protein
MERVTKFFTSLGGVLTSLATIVAGVVALYVAFGGGGDKSSNTPPPPPVATTSNAAALEDWRSDAESICRDANSQVIALGPNPGGDPNDSDARITWLQNVIPIVATYTNQLRALDEPAEAQADIDRLLDTMVKVTDSAQTMVNAYQVFDFETTNTARLELQGAIDDMQRQMAELGLKRCLTFS